MASYNKLQAFVEHLAEGVHNFAAHQVVVAMTTNANVPSPSADLLLADITPISHANIGDAGGTEAQRNITTASSGQSGGTYALVLTDKILTAVGAVATFRHVVHFNTTPTSPADPLLNWYDHGSDVTLANGETYTIDYGASFFTLA
jgi:hypothetical protein